MNKADTEAPPGKTAVAEMGEAPPQVRQPPWWTPRLGAGMAFPAWLRILRRHRYDIDLPRLPRAVAITLVTVASGFGALLQRLLHGRKIAAGPVPPPVFIVGHWRSGTTFLHELMAADPRFVAPTTFECFCPDHFMRLSRVITWMPFLMPRSRPMDDMPMGWNMPQEDEFALMAKGVGSPYETIFFPNHRPAGIEYLHPDRLPDAGREAWQQALVAFLKAVAHQRGRERRKRRYRHLPPFANFLLKSPTHTARIALLARLFPGARFIHVVRDPQKLFASSRLLWPALSSRQLLHATAGEDRPGSPALDDYIFALMDALYDGFDEAVAALPPGSFAEVRYEDLVRAPRAELARLYAALGLGDPPASPAMDAYLAARAGYRPNRHELDPALADRVRARWRWYRERFGY